MNDRVVIGTRGSRLALWQAAAVSAMLQRCGLDSETRVISTRGDRVLDRPLQEIGDKALFTAELDQALLSGEIQAAVHSMKDMPTLLPEGLEIGAAPERAAPWDVLVARDSAMESIAGLPPGGTVATSSLRRRAQLLAWRPDLTVVPIRGNVETRVRKLDESNWDGVILAEAGLRRLDMAARITARFPLEIMVPATAQGTLAVVSKVDAPVHVRRGLRAIDNPMVRAVAQAERAFLRLIEGGCHAPVGAYGFVEETGDLILQAVVASVDGRTLLRLADRGSYVEPRAVGVRLGNRMLEEGGRELLASIPRMGADG